MKPLAVSVFMVTTLLAFGPRANSSEDFAASVERVACGMAVSLSGGKPLRLLKTSISLDSFSTISSAGFSCLDSLTQIAKQTQIVCCVYGSSVDAGTPEKRGELVKLFASLAKRYQGRVSAWQVWRNIDSEASWPDADPDSYISFLQDCCAAIRSSDPRAFVITGDLTGPNYPYLSKLAAKTVQKSWNAIGMRLNLFAPGPIDAQIANILDGINAVAGGAQVCVELDWKSAPGAKTANTSAWDSLACAILLAHGAKCVFLPVEGLDARGERAETITNLSNIFGKASPVGPALTDGPARGWVFRDGPSVFSVYWTANGETVKTALPVDNRSRVLDCSGRRLPPQKNDYQISSSPVFVLAPQSRVTIDAARNRKRFGDSLIRHGNLLKNGGFEEIAKDGFPFYGWQPAGFNGGDEKTNVKIGLVHGRMNVLEMANPDSAVVESWPVPVRPGLKYKLTAWSQSAASKGKAQAVIDWYGADGRRWIGANYTQPVINNGNWAEISVSAIAPALASYARIKLSATEFNGDISFDDIEFCMVEEAAP